MKVRFGSAARRGAWRILSPRQMQAADAFTIGTLGIPGVALMETAGRHLAVETDALARERGLAGGSVGIVCGGGNNGGDGFVAARHLADWGYETELLLCGDPERMVGDAAINLSAARALRLPMRVLKTPAEVVALPSPGHYDLLVDALLGTGLSGEVRGTAPPAIEWMNVHGAPVVACDIPSGLCGDSGRPLGAAVRATRTVTFGSSQPGHWLYPGPDYTGELVIVDIGIPDGVLSAQGSGMWVLGDAELREAFPARGADTHKGTFGHVYVLAGSLGKGGAARMAADGALRAGAGLASIGTVPEVVAALSGAVYETMVEVGFDLGDGESPAATARRWADRAARRDAVVIGPGMPTGTPYGDALAAMLPALEVPAVVDADALNHLAGRPEAFRGAGPRVLTPHPGEAARLLGCGTAEVQADRIGSALRLARETASVVVLKGAHTLVTTPEDMVGVCADGNPGMATAGMGDVLAGMIGALLARGLGAEEAAAAAVVWHARAGDAAAAARSRTTMVARDVIEALPRVEVACSDD